MKHYTNKWMSNHLSDQYVRKGYKMKVRSRAWFKLDQINSVDSLLYSGMVVVDLGSTPGGWSKYAKRKIGEYGRVISCDILPMNKIEGVDFLQGDFCDPKVLSVLIKKVKKGKVDVVLSDMCPNISGKSNIDIPKLIYLGELSLSFCKYVLISGGSYLVKVFQGEGFDDYFNSIRSLFSLVKIRKPCASYAHSREVYIVAKGYKT